jgi:hypothetical protein
VQVGNENFEILVRRQGEAVYSAFCPQLELIVRGTAHQQVEEKMKQLILDHVAKRDEAKAGDSRDNSTAQ